jgi:hypothetical protein
MHPDAIAACFGTEAVLRLWRIAIFRTGFPSSWDCWRRVFMEGFSATRLEG